MARVSLYPLFVRSVVTGDADSKNSLYPLFLRTTIPDDLVDTAWTAVHNATITARGAWNTCSKIRDFEIATLTINEIADYDNSETGVFTISQMIDCDTSWVAAASDPASSWAEALNAAATARGDWTHEVTAGRDFEIATLTLNELADYNGDEIDVTIANMIDRRTTWS